MGCTYSTNVYSVAVGILSQNTLQSRPADCYSRYLETMNFGQYMLAWFNVSKVIVFGWEKDFVYNEMAALAKPYQFY